MLGLSCGQPDRDEQAEETLPPPLPVPQECIRCKQPSAFTQRGTAYCQSCFLQVLSSRFNRALEGARAVSAAGFEAYETPEVRPRRTERAPDGKVVVAFSGGASSRAVLELLRTTCFTHLAGRSSDPAPAAPSTDTSAGGKKKGKRHPLPRPPVFADCEVVYVDESSVPGNEPADTAKIREIITADTPFRFTSLALEDVFSPAYSSSSSPDPLIAGISASLPLLPSRSDFPALTHKERLHALLSPLSPSSRASLLTTLRHALLLAHARATRVSILLLGSTGTRLAIDMLAGMASGRGWSAGEEVGAEYVSRAADSREGGSVLVVRPFALVSAREARFLCESEGLRHVDAPQSAEGEKEKEGERSAKGRSIDALVEDFVLTLDASFASTAQTVLRTSHKLGLRSSAPSAHLCALCGLPAQPAAAEWRAAITISDLAGAKAALEDAQAAAVALPEGTGGVRAPYAPSPAHLLAAVGDEEPAPEPASVPAPAVEENVRASLAPHLCYGCLLVLQEPGSAPLAKGRQQRAGEIVLPPWVGDVVRAREASREEGHGREEGEGEVVGTREVHGVEAMRKEVEGFLLDAGEA